MDSIDKLLELMARLRGPGGCPWDRQQTITSLRSYVLEEAHEVAEAIDSGNTRELRGELGDLLLQIVFLSRLGEERGEFTFEDVARSISDKLVRRHPHVFGDQRADDAEHAFRHWEQAKAAESAAGTDRSRLDGVPRGLPALIRAQRLADRAARAGFDWKSPAGVLDKLDEEIAELRVAVEESNAARVEEELGDLLFACASLARTVDADAEGSLARASSKFERRFRSIERSAAEAGTSLDQLDSAELEALWRDVKRSE